VKAAAALLALLLAGCQTPPPPPPPSPPEPSQAEVVREHLAQLLADTVPACGAVRQYRRQDRLDYRVDCSSGQAFRVRVLADGRVLITPLAP